jgi:hypothetical protein
LVPGFPLSFLVGPGFPLSFLVGTWISLYPFGMISSHPSSSPPTQEIHTVGRQSISGSSVHIKVRSEVGSFHFLKILNYAFFFFNGQDILTKKFIWFYWQIRRESDFMSLVVFP